MTAKWICRPCEMLCLGQAHYDRHRAGDHSATTEEERASWHAEHRAYWAARIDGEIAAQEAEEDRPDDVWVPKKRRP